MKEQTIAKVYANTFTELGKDHGVDVAKELTNLTETINASNDLENVLFLEVFTVEEKSDILKKVAEKIGLSPVVTSSVLYLIAENRISILPLIFKEVIVADDKAKGFLRGSIEGLTDQIDEGLKDKLVNYLKKNLDGGDIILDYKKNENITAGYKVTIGDYQLDATADKQLESFKNSVLG